METAAPGPPHRVLFTTCGLNRVLSVLPDMFSHPALCGSSETPLVCVFLLCIFQEGGLTNRRQKQTADDLLLIASSSSFFPPLFPPPSPSSLALSPLLGLIAHSPRLPPLFLSPSSSSPSHHSFVCAPSPTVYHTHHLLVPPALFKARSPTAPPTRPLPLPLDACIFSHLSVLSSHSFAPAPHHPSLTLSFHSLPHSPRRCYSACLPACLSVCSIKGCLRPLPG